MYKQTTEAWLLCTLNKAIRLFIFSSHPGPELLLVRQEFSGALTLTDPTDPTAWL